MVRRLGPGLLILAVFALGGWNVELRRRVGRLEEDLARRAPERKRGVVDPPPPPPPAPEPVHRAAPAPETAPPRRVDPVPPPASARGVRPAAARPLFAAVLGDGSLSPEQRAAIAELRRSTDERTRAAREVIEQIERSAEAALRNLLTPEQLARLDSGRIVAWEASTLQAAPAAPGSGSGYLGVVGQDAPGGGVRIGHVVPGTAAAAGGLRPGDVVLEVDGRPVRSYAELLGLLRSAHAGLPVSLRIRRGTGEFYQGFQLDHRP